MQFTSTKIPDVVLIEPKIYADHRGFFFEVYQVNHFMDAGINTRFVQDNHAGSRQGVLRGLHYQIRSPQGKLIKVVVGEIFDVAVDIRRSSPTFGTWVGAMLTAENKHQLWVPRGFAHGYYVVSEWAEVLYKTTDYYAPQWERTILWNDTEIGIDWPILPRTSPILSDKDSQGKPLNEADVFN